MDQNKFGKYIEELRKKKGLTQKELAEKLGLSNTAVSKWECGYNLPDISLFEPLSKILDVDISNFINLQSNEETTEINTLLKTTSPKIKRIINLSTLITTILFIVLTLFVILKNDSNDILNSNTRVYEISSLDKQFKINGYLIFNEKENSLIINNLKYQDFNNGTKEVIKTNNLTMYLMIDSEIIYKLSCQNEKNNYYEINELFLYLLDNENYTATTKQDLLKYESRITDSYIRINYTTKARKDENIDIKISLKKIFT